MLWTALLLHCSPPGELEGTPGALGGGEVGKWGGEGGVIGRVLAQEIGHLVFSHNLVTLQPCNLQNVTSLSFRFFCYNTEKDRPA